MSKNVGRTLFRDGWGLRWLMIRLLEDIFPAKQFVSRPRHKLLRGGWSLLVGGRERWFEGNRGFRGWLGSMFNKDGRTSASLGWACSAFNWPYGKGVADFMPRFPGPIAIAELVLGVALADDPMTCGIPFLLNNLCRGRDTNCCEVEVVGRKLRDIERDFWRMMTDPDRAMYSRTGNSIPVGLWSPYGKA